MGMVQDNLQDEIPWRAFDSNSRRAFIMGGYMVNFSMTYLLDIIAHNLCAINSDVLRLHS
jgi:hypothetical protein